MSTSKEILFEGERCRHPNTGLYHYCTDLYSHLFENAPPELKLNFLGPKDHPFEVSGASESIRPLTLLNRATYSFRHKKRFLNARQRHCDLVHLTYQGTYYPSLYPKKAKKLLTIHDLNFLHEKVSPEKIARSIRTIQYRIDQADHLVFISKFAQQDAEKFLEIKNTPHSVIHNGCAYSSKKTENFTPVSGVDRPFLLTLGTVNPKKNFHTLLPLLLNNELQLIISGIKTISYTDEILKSAQSLGISDRLLLTGPVSEPEKNWLYQNCTAFLFPSLAEGFGLPPIEAMSFGKPVFLSNRTSLPEVGGSLAYYFNSFEAEEMISVYQKGMAHFENHPEQETLIREHARTFSWERAAKAYLEVYSQLLELK